MGWKKDWGDEELRQVMRYELVGDGRIERNDNRKFACLLAIIVPLDLRNKKPLKNSLQVLSS